ncbi:MAG TPA: hypothetical protein DIT18_02565 [Pseudomonas sp.]|nr:hypothetical protein [Pseudomonas sp.]
MSTKPSPYKLDSQMQALHQSAANLTQYACIVSARHIKDGVLRGQFNRDMAYYVRQVLSDVRSAKVSPGEGLKQIRSWHDELKPHFDTGSGIVGLRAALYQIFDGFDLCRSRAGCIVGLPMIAHGTNNFYENGHNLWTGRSDATGPVRWVYRRTARWMGKDPIKGDIAYGSVDISLSAVSLFRPVPKKGAWKLFRYIDSDMQSAYKRVGKIALVLDGAATWMTMEKLYGDVNKDAEK